MLHRRREKHLIWLFGSPRSGSTWLLNLLAASPSIDKHDEPGIGIHLGVSLESVIGVPSQGGDFRAFDVRRRHPAYFFSDSTRNAWAGPLRRLLLCRLRPRAQWLAIKEPHGSDAADILLSVLPRSRCLFLLRDGRDVVDSALDAATSGGQWTAAVRKYEGKREDFIRGRAEAWLRRTAVVEQAFASHPEHLRMMVRYEDLRADPLPELERLAAWLSVDAGPLVDAVDLFAFEKLPPEKRGPGQFTRSARPGAWRDNLTLPEQAVLEETLGEKVRALGYGA